MCFFRKPIYDDVVCPYCFSKYPNNQVHFRDIGKEDAEIDEKLDNFWVKICHQQSRGRQGKVYEPNPKGKYEFVTFVDEHRKKHLKLVGFTPAGKAQALTNRICKDCHNPLPTALGNGSSKVIAVLGSTQIGKTVYINSLINELKKITKKYKRDVTFNFVDTGMKSSQSKIDQKVLAGTLEASNVAYIDPVICELKTNAFSDNVQHTIITFYDFPGESKDDDIKKFSIRQILAADAALILFDLTQTDTLADSYKKYQIKMLEAEKESLLETLNGSFTEESINAYFEQKDGFDTGTTADYDKIIADLQQQKEEAQKKYDQIKDDESQVINVDRMKKQIELLEKRIRDQQALKAASQQARQAQKSAMVKLFGREITVAEKACMEEMSVLEKKIKRLEEDRKHPGMYYDSAHDSYEMASGPKDWLELTYNNAVVNDNDKNKPTAIVGSKSDVVLEIAKYGCFDDENADIADNAEILNHEVVQTNRFNIDEAERIHMFVENQLLKDDVLFTSSVRSRFRNFHFFAVSALGTGYIEKNGQKILPTETITPWRVDEPMLWLLYQLGIID